jgi:hypothetical protein
MSTINPFELLGLTPNSSMEDARRSFRELVLVVHPDKGGDDNQLHILVNAYRFVKEGLSAVTESKCKLQQKSVADLEKEFADFCNLECPISQYDDDIKEFVSSQTSTFDIEGFNRRFHDTHGMLAPVNEGYGHLMLATDDPETKPAPAMKREIVVYTEPKSIHNSMEPDMFPTHDYMNVFNELKEDHAPVQLEDVIEKFNEIATRYK